MDIDLPNVACPDCSAKVRVTLDDVAKQRTVRCSRGHAVTLKDQGGGARKATRAMDDFEQALKKLGN